MERTRGNTLGNSIGKLDNSYTKNKQIKQLNISLEDLMAISVKNTIVPSSTKNLNVKTYFNRIEGRVFKKFFQVTYSHDCDGVACGTSIPIPRVMR